MKKLLLATCLICAASASAQASPCNVTRLFGDGGAIEVHRCGQHCIPIRAALLRSNQGAGCEPGMLCASSKRLSEMLET
jgi:hypothetical protein